MVIDDAYRIAVPAEWPAFAWLGRHDRHGARPAGGRRRARQPPRPRVGARQPSRIASTEPVLSALQREAEALERPVRHL
jgi:hypothetical protein